MMNQDYPVSPPDNLPVSDANRHPITPPPELVQQWIRERDGLEHVVAKAARWGADQELEECCAYIGGEGRWFANPEPRLAGLRQARRPKPPSLKQQALALLGKKDAPVMLGTPEYRLSESNADTIRRALEQLDG